MLLPLVRGTMQMYRIRRTDEGGKSEKVVASAVLQIANN